MENKMNTSEKASIDNLIAVTLEFSEVLAIIALHQHLCRRAMNAPFERDMNRSVRDVVISIRDQIQKTNPAQWERLMKSSLSEFFNELEMPASCKAAPREVHHHYYHYPPNTIRRHMSVIN